MVCLTSCVFRSLRFSGFARPHSGVRREGELYTQAQAGGTRGSARAQDGHKLGDNNCLGGFPGTHAPPPWRQAAPPRKPHAPAPRRRPGPARDFRGPHPGPRRGTASQWAVNTSTPGEPLPSGHRRGPSPAGPFAHAAPPRRGRATRSTSAPSFPVVPRHLAHKRKEPASLCRKASPMNL